MDMPDNGHETMFALKAELARVNQRLLESESALQETRRLARIGSWQWDASSGAIHWSDELHRMLGYDQSLPAPRLAEQQGLFSAESWSRLLAAFETALRTGEAYALHMEFVPRHGPRGWLEARGEVVRNAQGQIIGLRGTAQNVTEQVELQTALRDSEARLRSSFLAMTEGLALQQHDGQIIDANPAAEAILGLSRDQLMGRSSMDPDWQAVREDGSPFPGHEHPAMVALRTNQTVRRQIMGVQAPSFGQRWLSVSAVPMAEPGAATAHAVVVTFDDITELHNALQTLQQLTMEQSAVLESELIGLVKVKQRHFSWVSQGAARIFGYQPDELIGRSTRMLYAHGQDHERVTQAMGPEGQVGQPFRSQLEMVRKDGRTVWIDKSSMLLSDATGESLALLVDITPIKAAEATRVNAIAMDAENAQLREVARLKDQFLANMSHELRTPLNAVIGFAQLLKSGVVKSDSPKYLSYVNQIGASGQHLLQLINSMLDFARAESGKIEFHPEPVALAAVIKDVIDMLQDKCEQQHVLITMSVAHAMPMVEVDPMRLRQILLNLIGNAVKFSKVGGVVDVRATQVGTNFRVEVEDQGIGIAEAALPKLFTHFNQISQGTAKTAEGTGLGLAFVRRMAEAQGGSVGVRSQLGQGSVFYLVLPCRVAPPR